MEHRNAYGLVTNLGTTEHVANQANAFKIIHDLTAVGGIMMHRLPAQGYMMHGLVNYNAKFFWMLARSNAYRFLDMNFEAEYEGRPLHDNIADFIMQFRPRPSQGHTVDSNFNLILQKIVDEPYTPPLDVPTGAAPPNEQIKQRYWAVYSQWLAKS